MLEINDHERLETILERNRIRDLFDTKELDFRLVSYEKGEILSFLRDSDSCLQFPVAGQIVIYALQDDGSRRFLCKGTDFSILGDIEFAGVDAPPFLVEAVEPVLCVELPLYRIRSQLHSDIRFLHFLLKALAVKLSAFSRDQTGPDHLTDRVLNLFESSSEHTLQGVDTTASCLHCSRRQLQRILSMLVAKGIIQKTGKGKYQKL